MKPEEQIILMEQLAEEERHPDTIFLHRQDKGWIAYQHSALLFQRYFTPVRLREIVMDPVRVLCAVWSGPVNIRQSPTAQEFSFSSDDHETMSIKCPAALTDEEFFTVIRNPDVFA